MGFITGKAFQFQFFGSCSGIVLQSLFILIYYVLVSPAHLPSYTLYFQENYIDELVFGIFVSFTIIVNVKVS